MIRKELGKIEKVYYGFGGYQDVMTGITFTLSMGGSGVCDFWGMWSDRSKHCKWTLKDQIDSHGEVVNRITKLLHEAKVNRVDKLAGIPIEVTMERNTLKSWRVLTEVL